MKTKPELELADVKLIAAAAEAEALKNHWAVTIAIVDDGGHLLWLQRLDGAPAVSSHIAPAKAHTAALGRRESKGYEDVINGGRTSFLSAPALQGMLEGGVPILKDGQCLGAVGVSGVKSNEDAQIARAGIAALGETLGALDAWLQGPPPANPREAWAWRELGGGAAGKPIFPVRPLIFGGDDVTLVCDGRLGLALAGRYLAAFAGAAVALPLGEDTRPAQACAGVAIVKVHYPFARAYALADALCGSAKSALRAEGLSQASALDWHIAAAGLDGTLEAIRAQGYTHKEAGDVTLRPVTAGPPGFGRWRSWGTVEALIAEFDQPDRWSRNKLLGLREQLVRGAEVTRAYRETFDLPSFEALAQHGGDAAATGWVAERCAAFDAIEAQDFWVALP